MIKRVQVKGETWYRLYRTREEAEERERQVMFFKNQKKTRKA